MEKSRKSLKTLILGKNECISILSTIARDGKLDSDRIMAIQQLSKMEGWEAPIKLLDTRLAVNNVDLQVIDIVKNNTPEEVAKLVKKILAYYSADEVLLQYANAN